MAKWGLWAGADDDECNIYPGNLKIQKQRRRQVIYFQSLSPLHNAQWFKAHVQREKICFSYLTRALVKKVTFF